MKNSSTLFIYLFLFIQSINLNNHESMKRKFFNLMKGLLFAVVWIISLGMVAQTSIQGTVTDAGGTPMIGVNVIE
ncbi:MAG TPA: hypothetical protein DDZ78_10615, partial [Porphyromonadaceae bacterium]|nr:hypothetical protein [Porphyromonadaceae bacterium]